MTFHMQYMVYIYTNMYNSIVTLCVLNNGTLHTVAIIIVGHCLSRVNLRIYTKDEVNYYCGDGD